MPVRVLMLSKACLVGIYQRKLEAIAAQPSVDALRVLVPPSWQDERGVTHLERAHTDGYDLEVTPIRLNGNFHLHFYPRFAADLQDFQPDIVHLDEEPYNLATWLALRAARHMGAKSLFFSWQNILRRYPPPFAWGERWVLRQVDYALMGTESAAAVWRAKGYAGPLSVVPQFGVDVARFTPPETRPADRLRIGYVGRLVHEKGVDLLQAALADWDAPWELHIVGGGPTEKDLRAQASRLGIAPRVTFHGQVASLDMPDHFRNLDVLVIPSRTMPNWKEQFGRVIIEAMASEVLVVGSNSGAIPDVIGDAGLVFPENDVAALGERLRWAGEHPHERAAIAQQGRLRALGMFTQEQIAQQTVDAYRAMMAQ
ncbi:MAG: glycosyltransferase family 4 protein [Anaerolineales bacterium]